MLFLVFSQIIPFYSRRNKNNVDIWRSQVLFDFSLISIQQPNMSLDRTIICSGARNKDVDDDDGNCDDDDYGDD